MQQKVHIAKLQEGDEASFRLLVDRYKNKVYNICLGFVRNKEDADDLSQEVFLEVFGSISNFREEASIGSWIYRIAVNKSLEFLRKKKSKKRWAFLQSIFSCKEDDYNESTQKSDDTFHPGIALENLERAGILFKAIEKLPENQRVAFTLHKIEDLSYQEISEIMKLSLSSVESLIFRARKNLQKFLYQYYEKTEKE